MNSIIDKLNDGGPVFTYTILVLILVIFGIFAWTIVKSDDQQKMRSLIANIGWIALAWGYLGRTFGLIMAFDNVAVAGQITPELMAGGLKMALVDPLMGISAFVIARLCLIILTLVEKRKLSTTL